MTDENWCPVSEPTRDDRAEAVRRTYTREPQPEIAHWIETGELAVRKVQDRHLIALSESIAAERAAEVDEGEA